MGTNYYLKIPQSETCDHCGRADRYDTLHVGKSSGGWKFLFDTEYGKFKSFKDWREVLEKYPNCLFDEYEKKVSLEEFYKIVESKQGGIDLDDYLEQYPELAPKTIAGKVEVYTLEFYDKDGYRFSTSSDFS